MSVRKAVELSRLSHGGRYVKSQVGDQSTPRLRIRVIAHGRPRFGYQRIHVVLRREGWKAKRKRVWRWYRFEGQQIRMRVRCRKQMSLHRGPVPQVRGTHERWSMDFVHDQLFGGRYGVAALDRAIERAGSPVSIAIDHGTGFTSKVLEEWAYRRGST